MFDGAQILHVTSRTEKIVCPISAPDNFAAPELFDHDYIKSWWNLSVFVENIVQYIAGYVCYKLRKVIDCEICKEQLLGKEMPLLSGLKNRGPYLSPAKDVCDLCKSAESIIRGNQSRFGSKNIKLFLVNETLRTCRSTFINTDMNNHVLSQSVLDNHRFQLCKLVVQTFIDCRLFYESVKMSEKNKSLRSKYTKLVLFTNQ